MSIEDISKQDIMNPNRFLYKSKLVRDLAWSIGCPHILREGNPGFPIVPDSFAKQVFENSQEWLAELDEDPRHMILFLTEHEAVFRLGYYFEGLIQYWLRFAPCLRTSQFVHRFQINGCTLKFAVALNPTFDNLGPRVFHFESSVKFFLDVGLEECDEPNSARVFGPFLLESLITRVGETVPELVKLNDPVSRCVLLRALDQNLDVKVSSMSFLRGCLYAPAPVFADTFARRRTLGSGEHSPLADLPVEGPMISPVHPMGFWHRGTTVEDIHFMFEKVLAGLSGDATRKLRDGDFDGIRVAVLGKHHWLSPALGIESSDGLVRIDGQLELGIATLRATSVEEFCLKLSKVPLKAIHIAVLTRATNTEAARLQGVAGDEQTNGAWVERARGFLLASTWSPKRLKAEQDMKGGKFDFFLDGESMTQLPIELPLHLQKAIKAEAIQHGTIGGFHSLLESSDKTWHISDAFPLEAANEELHALLDKFFFEPVIRNYNPELSVHDIKNYTPPGSRRPPPSFEKDPSGSPAPKPKAGRRSGDMQTLAREMASKMFLFACRAFRFGCAAIEAGIVNESDGGISRPGSILVEAFRAIYQRTSQVDEAVGLTEGELRRIRIQAYHAMADAFQRAREDWRQETLIKEARRAKQALVSCPSLNAANAVEDELPDDVEVTAARSCVVETIRASIMAKQMEGLSLADAAQEKHQEVMEGRAAVVRREDGTEVKAIYVGRTFRRVLQVSPSTCSPEELADQAISKCFAEPDAVTICELVGETVSFLLNGLDKPEEWSGSGVFPPLPLAKLFRIANLHKQSARETRRQLDLVHVARGGIGTSPVLLVSSLAGQEIDLLSYRGVRYASEQISQAGGTYVRELYGRNDLTPQEKHSLTSKVSTVVEGAFDLLLSLVEADMQTAVASLPVSPSQEEDLPASLEGVMRNWASDGADFELKELDVRVSSFVDELLIAANPDMDEDDGVVDFGASRFASNDESAEDSPLDEIIRILLNVLQFVTDLGACGEGQVAEVVSLTPVNHLVDTNVRFMFAVYGAAVVRILDACNCSRFTKRLFLDLKLTTILRSHPRTQQILLNDAQQASTKANLPMDEEQHLALPWLTLRPASSPLEFATSMADASSFAACIQIVDTPARLTELTAHIHHLTSQVPTQGKLIASVDFEWRPTTFQPPGVETYPPVSLMQLCLPTLEVFLIDLLLIMGPFIEPVHRAHGPGAPENYRCDPESLEETACCVSSFFDAILFSPRAAVIGFDPLGDFRVLRRSFRKWIPAFVSDEKCQSANVHDARLVGSMSSGITVTSLSEMTRSVLGRSLLKKEQVSDWAHRPLLHAQIEYAALDAAVLWLAVSGMRGGLQIVSLPGETEDDIQLDEGEDDEQPAVVAPTLIRSPAAPLTAFEKFPKQIVKQLALSRASASPMARTPQLALACTRLAEWSRSTPCPLTSSSRVTVPLAPSVEELEAETKLPSVGKRVRQVSASKLERLARQAPRLDRMEDDGREIKNEDETPAAEANDAADVLMRTSDDVVADFVKRGLPAWRLRKNVYDLQQATPAIVEVNIPEEHRGESGGAATVSAAVVKSLVVLPTGKVKSSFTDEGSLANVFMCLVPVKDRIHLHAASLALGGFKIHLAHGYHLPALVGYTRGSIGPFGLREPAKATLIEKKLLQHEWLLVGGGEASAEVLIRAEELVAIADNPMILRIVFN